MSSPILPKSHVEDVEPDRGAKAPAAKSRITNTTDAQPQPTEPSAERAAADPSPEPRSNRRDGGTEEGLRRPEAARQAAVRSD